MSRFPSILVASILSFAFGICPLNCLAQFKVDHFLSGTKEEERDLKNLLQRVSPQSLRHFDNKDNLEFFLNNQIPGATPGVTVHSVLSLMTLAELYQKPDQFADKLRYFHKRGYSGVDKLLRDISPQGTGSPYYNEAFNPTSTSLTTQSIERAFQMAKDVDDLADDFSTTYALTQWWLGTGSASNVFDSLLPSTANGVVLGLTLQTIDAGITVLKTYDHTAVKAQIEVYRGLMLEGEVVKSADGTRVSNSAAISFNADGWLTPASIIPTSTVEVGFWDYVDFMIFVKEMFGNTTCQSSFGKMITDLGSGGTTSPKFNYTSNINLNVTRDVWEVNRSANISFQISFGESTNTQCRKLSVDLVSEDTNEAIQNVFSNNAIATSSTFLPVSIASFAANRTASSLKLKATLTYEKLDGSGNKFGEFTLVLEQPVWIVGNTVGTSNANRLPVAQPLTAKVAKGGLVLIPLIFHDPDGKVLSLSVTSNPSYSVVHSGSTPELWRNYFAGVANDYTSVLYRHNGSNASSDSFQYVVIDDKGARSAPATISIQVQTSPVNDSIVTIPQTVVVEQGEPIPITLTGGSTQVSQVNRTITTPPVAGSITKTVTGADTDMIYRAPSATGTQTLTYRVQDAAGNQKTESITIQVVAPTQHAPVAQNSLIAVQPAGSSNFVLKATDGNGDALTWQILTPPTKGNITGTAPNLTYTRGASYGLDSDFLRFRVTDTTGRSSEGVVNFMVSNTPPVIGSLPNRSAAVGEKVIASITATDAPAQTVTLSLAAGSPGVIDAQNNWSHTFSSAGAYTVTIIATDKAGSSSPILSESRKSFTVVVGGQVEFTDVPATHPHYMTVMDAAKTRGFVGYTGAGGLLFRPNQAITRGEFLSMILKYSDSPVDVTGTPLPDVPPSHTHFAAIQTFKNRSVVVGYGSGNFGPDNYLQRQEMAIILNGLAQWGWGEYTAAPYTDVTLTPPNGLSRREWNPIWNSINQLKANGLLSLSNNFFRPFDSATRLEALLVLEKFAGLSRSDVPSGGSNLDYNQASGGQLNAVYVPASGAFTLNYSLGATVTKAWIQASTNGSSWTQVAAIDPVTASNRTGTRTVTVAGSNTANLMYFRLRTQVGNATVVSAPSISTAYTPTPSQPKSTEIPIAPILIINGDQVAQQQVQMFWRRVNDSENRDNVTYYEMQQSTNSSFAGASTVNIGNTTAGQNMYESVFYTATGLSDNSTWYFRVRGVNLAGTGAWSNTDSINVNIQDRPVFDVNPVFPPHGATGVSKLPKLEFDCIDPDGDTLDYYIYCGTTPTEMRRIRGFDDPLRAGVQQLETSEWENQLRPNTRYYWRVEVREIGRDKAYYGGAYPTSPTWEFVTDTLGANLTITNATRLSGSIQPNSQLTYRVNVTNTGNEVSQVNYLKVAYIKNATESLFSSVTVTPPVFPALDPGQTLTTDVSFRFRNDLWTSPTGVVHDNILLVGSSSIRFFFQDIEQNLSTASYTLPINYANAGGPVFNSFVLSNSNGGNRGGVPRGGSIQIDASIRDDVRTTRAVIEYRLNAQSNWVFLDEYTGNTSASMQFGLANHSGPTISSPTSSTILWNIPSDFPLTSTMEMRITAYDDQGIISYGISPNFAVFDDSLQVNVGVTDSSIYRLGQVVKIPVSIITKMNVNSFVVTYKQAPGGQGQELLNLTGSASAPLVIPPIISLNLPTTAYLSSETAFLEISVGASSGYGGRIVSDATDNVFALRNNELPAPFQDAIILPLSGSFAYPSGATNKVPTVSVKAMEWEGETAIQMIAAESHSYSLSGSTYESTEVFYWIRYDHITKEFTKTLLPSGYTPLELRVMGAIPHVLLQTGNSAYITSRPSGTFVTPSLLETFSLLYPDEIGLVKRGGSDLYLSYTINREQSSSMRRNRLKRILPLPSITSEHPNIWHGYYPCYGTHLSTRGGVYPINGDLTLGLPLIQWTPQSYYPLRFTNTGGPIVGSRIFVDSNTPWLETIGASSEVYRWSVPMASVNVKSLSNYSIAVGISPVGRADSNDIIVTRLRHTTMSEEKVSLGLRPVNDDVHKHSAISDGGMLAVAWGRLQGYFAIANMSGDITAPTVQINSSDDTYTTGQSKTFGWTMSDNLNQIASVKVLKDVNGVSSQIGNYTSGVLPTSINYTFNDSASNVTIRVEVYDQNGNRGVSEKVLLRSSAFSFSSFTSNSYSTSMGNAVSLTWTATPADAFRVYNILTKQQGSADWIYAASVTGNTHLLDTSLLSGAVEVRVESGGTVRDLPQTLIITGNRFAFDNSRFTPSPTSVHVASSSPVVRLSWVSNQAESPDLLYTVLGRYAISGAGSAFAVLGATTEKNIEVNVGSNNLLEWRVVALWQGQEFVSFTRSITISALASPPTPTASVKDRHLQVPWVELNWASVAGAESYVVFRHNVITGATEELTRTTSASFRDYFVNYGERYRYSLAILGGGVISQTGNHSEVTITPSLPTGITFLNSNYELKSGNSNTVRWTVINAANESQSYQNFWTVLRKPDGTISDSQPVTPQGNGIAEVSYASLDYNESYAVEVYAYGPDGQLLNTQASRLHFSTGFDTRTISQSPSVTTGQDIYGFNVTWTAVTNADFYDVFRKTNGSELVWVGRSYLTNYLDTSVERGSWVSYVVTARNDNGYNDSALTPETLFIGGIYVSPSNIGIGATSGSTANANLSASINWTVSSSETWLSVNPSSGSSGVTLTLTALSTNPSTTNTRAATVTISADGVADQKITVTQAVSQPSVLSVMPTSSNPSYTAAQGLYFNVTSNSPWTASSDATWISLNQAAGSGNGQVSFNITENVTGVTREAIIYVTSNGSSVQHTVMQQVPPEPEYAKSISPAVKYLPSEGGTYRIDVVSQTGWSITYPEDAGVSLSTQSGAGNDFFMVTLDENVDLLPRTWEIQIADKKHIVRQAGQLKVPEPATPVTATANRFFGSHVGTYQGLLKSGEVVEGAVTGLKVSATGAFSGKCILRGTSYSIKGTLASGMVDIALVNKALPTRTLRLTCAVAQNESLTPVIQCLTASGGLNTVGSLYQSSTYVMSSRGVADGTFVSLIVPDRSGENGSAPMGFGSFSFVTTPTGTAFKVTGTLGDGTRISGTVPGSQVGILPLYLAAGKTGYVGGELFVRNIPGTSDLDGVVSWRKLSATTGTYRSGFLASNHVIGCRHNPIGKALSFTSVSGLPDRVLELPILGSPASIVNDLIWSEQNRITLYDPTSKSAKLTYSSKTAAITGSAETGIYGGTVSLVGAVYQKQNVGFGLRMNKTSQQTMLFIVRDPN